MADTITIQGMQKRAKRFLAARSLEEMSRLLGKTALNLLALSQSPAYDEFTIPKKNGGLRNIEDPIPALKKVQRKLNDYLQAVYFFHRTDSAFGFLTNPVDDPVPRNILTNAQVHLGCQWLLNVDMKDFFHLISQDRIKQLFKAPLFGFQAQLAEVLAGLCCYKGRLPMGAPTSPILSNLVSIPLDHDLEHYAENNGWKYTRYADDMTFSGPTEITAQHIQEINEWVLAYDFKLNPKKIRHYSPELEYKEVTGLIVRENRIDLPEDYLIQLQKTIDYLDKSIDAKYSMPSGRGQKAIWLDELEEQIRGKLEYARQILGEDDLLYLDLVVQLDEALTPPDYYGPMAWLDFDYRLSSK